MPHVTNEQLRAFTTAFDAVTTRVGGGKLAIDSNALRAVVREHREAAYRYVELHCVMAASQPGYLQTAMIVATACFVEFEDTSLAEMVRARADELNAHQHIRGIGFGPAMNPQR
jgi:hypothetical protein